MKIKKILIALDYDPTSPKLAEYGFSLSKSIGADVILLHVISEPVFYSSTEHLPVLRFNNNVKMGAFQTDYQDGLRKASHHFLDKLKQHLGDKAIQTEVTEGDIAVSIIEVAKDRHADIIVMGCHTWNCIEYIEMDSVTEQVLHHTSIPLYIIPN